MLDPSNSAHLLRLFPLVVVELPAYDTPVKASMEYQSKWSTAVYLEPLPQVYVAELLWDDVLFSK